MEKILYSQAGQTRFACWITKDTDTHSEYVILLLFPWQQWLRERATILRYTGTACLVFYDDVYD